MIQIKDLHKSFGKLDVLKGISLEIREGEIVSVIGPSGSGKSTLLRCMNYLEKPQSGSIAIDGTTYDFSRELDAKAVWELRRNSSMVFQNYNLFQHRTVLENIMDPLVHVKRMEKDDAGNRAMELLSQVGLEEKAYVYPRKLSGGQQQRVAIARALAKNPKVLLCDEPTGALDYNTGKAVLKLLQNTCREVGKTVIVITHNQALTAMADRVITVKSGTVVSMVKNKDIVDIADIEW